MEVTSNASELLSSCRGGVSSEEKTPEVSLEGGVLLFRRGDNDKEVEHLVIKSKDKTKHTQRNRTQGKFPLNKSLPISYDQTMLKNPRKCLKKWKAGN
eukprot:6321938-Amphidinium_carterae.1